MINYFNFTPFKDAYLITNDLGSYHFVSEEELKALASGKVTAGSELESALLEKGFLFKGSEAAFIDRALIKVRCSKSYAFTATSLHIFVVTTSCNLACRYCQASCGSGARSMNMDAETARRAVDVALQSPAKHLSFEFQGGEPLVNFPAIKAIVEYAEEHRGSKSISYSLVSNLTLLTDEMLEFLSKHNVHVSTSLDGPAFVHDANRPFSSGKGSHDKVLDGIRRVREAGLGVGAIQTTTRANLAYAKELVDEYISAGFNSVFVRPMSPLGAAGKAWEEIGYTPEEFGTFYSEVLDYVVKANKGGRRMAEGHASLFLAKALNGLTQNYMELRSPCGASVGQVAYCPGGDVYTCDEGRMLAKMGDESFRLGNVFSDSYKDLMESSVCRAACVASVTESVPECCDCAYQPFCGICPVVNYAMYGDLVPKEARGYRCLVYKAMMEAVFSLLRENDEETINILRTWNS